MKHHYKKILAILWHWDPLRERKLDFDTVPIQDEVESLVCCIQHGRSTEAVGADMARCAKKLAAGGKLLMMIHRKSLNAEFHSELKHKIEAALPEGTSYDWKEFGDGSDYLYYDCKRDTGLLNQEGDFVIDDSYEFYSDDGAMQERLASVVVHSGEAEPVLKKNYFDQVWRYYRHELKRKLYDLERDLFLHFAHFTDPEFEQEGHNLANHLEANELLALRLNSFAGVNTDQQIAKEHRMLLFDHCSENLKAAYGPAALDAYEALRETINGLFLKKGDNHNMPPHVAIPQVRQQFVKLRSFMPEKITY